MSGYYYYEVSVAGLVSIFVNIYASRPFYMLAMRVVTARVLVVLSDSFTYQTRMGLTLM